MLLDTRRPSRPHAKSTWSGLQCQSARIELNARKKRPGWDVWGAEAPLDLEANDLADPNAQGDQSKALPGKTQLNIPKEVRDPDPNSKRGIAVYQGNAIAQMSVGVLYKAFGLSPLYADDNLTPSTNRLLDFTSGFPKDECPL